MFAQSVLRSFNFDVKVIKEGIYTFSKASLVESGCGVIYILRSKMDG
jgi:hypothetical protein